MDDFEKELKAGFLEEAQQALSDTEQCFLDLENCPNDPSMIDKIFRLAHNLKGSAKAVGFEQMGEFTHELESVLLKIKTGGNLHLNVGTINLLLRCNDHLAEMVATLKTDMAANIDSSALIDELKAHDLTATPQMEAQVFAEETPSAEDVAVAQNYLQAPTGVMENEPDVFKNTPNVLPFVKEVIAAETTETITDVAAATPLPVAHAAPANAHAGGDKKGAPASGGGENKGGAADESIRVSLARLEKLLDFVGEMVILQTVLREQSNSVDAPLVKKTVHQLGKVTKEVQDISMSLRMIPLKQTFQKMQRIVRDTTNALNKKVQFHMSGEETEMDKTILEHVSDPLVHLVRNACDHGIESAENRKKAGKNEQGNIYLSAFHQSGHIVIEVRDDGGGINPEKIKKIAIEKGILRKDANISDKEAINLIFHPGFSTKEVVTDVSGRGVGMDVVKTNIERLQGSVDLDTVVGQGSVFRIQLPLTLAIIDAMTIRTSGERYVIPLNHVFECVRPGQADVKPTAGLGEVLMLRGENLPLYRLSTLIGKGSGQQAAASECIAIVIRTQEQPFAVLVDDIIGQQQVVIKRLGPEAQIKGFSGSAILGDGRPALILEMSDLIQKNKGSSGVARPEVRRAA